MMSTTPFVPHLFFQCRIVGGISADFFRTPSPEGVVGVSDALGVDTRGRYVRRSHTPPSWALLSFSGSVTVLHESGEPTEVSSPDRLQDGPRSDARQTSTDPPRKRQRLLPRESRLRRTYLPEGESTTA